MGVPSISSWGRSIAAGAAEKKGVQKQQNQQHTVTATITSNPRVKYRVVNLPAGETEVKDAMNLPPKPEGFMLYNRRKIKGPYLKLIAGSNGMAGKLVVQEGLWEHKLGRKIDGGERRRAEVQAKKRSEERKKNAAV